MILDQKLTLGGLVLKFRDKQLIFILWNISYASLETPHQDYENLISFVRFDNSLNLARTTREQSGKTKLANITILTLAPFHNKIDISVLLSFKYNVQHTIYVTISPYIHILLSSLVT